ncbi:MAG: host specificity protein [Gemmatimonadetes bacterium]|nr:host specificity protein [Gemmatimonadota bacterium]
MVQIEDRRRYALALVSLFALSACGGESSEAATDGTSATTPPVTSAAQSVAIRLWAEGQPAFGIFVPSERPRGERGPAGERPPALYTTEGGTELGRNDLLDYLFLNLEGSYDAEAISAISSGLGNEGTSERKTLLVRIPPISADGPEAARARVVEALERGADGVVLPHVRSAEEAALAVSFFTDAGADVWSPTNPTGTTIAMIMIEDPGALAEVRAIADTPGYSVLACGIGSLTRALDGDREAAEAGNLEVLGHATRIGMPDMITANSDDVARRIEEGFLGLLMNGPQADEAIRVGRAAVGR